MDEDLYGSDLKLLVETGEYAGIGVDLTVSRKGELTTVSGMENLGQALLHRLLTRKGELADLGHPAYGSRLHELIGEPNTADTRELIRMYAKECIMTEPRVRDIVSIKVDTYKDNPGAVILDVVVAPIGSTVPLNLVFPYFLEVA